MALVQNRIGVNQHILEPLRLKSGNTDRVDRILVVEDDPLALEALTDLLESHGFSVIGASDGQEALERTCASDPKPSLILLDLGLPVMDGWEFLRRLRSDAKVAHIPVIVVTAIPSPEISPADAVVKKPVDVHQLLTLLAQYQRPFKLANH